MKNLRLALALAALTLTDATWGGLLDEICDAAVENGLTATAEEYTADPKAHADDFCALARFDKVKAARQLGASVATTRARANANRYYFPFSGPDGEYIQIRRPGMGDEWELWQRKGVERYGRGVRYNPFIWKYGHTVTGVHENHRIFSIFLVGSRYFEISFSNVWEDQEFCGEPDEVKSTVERLLDDWVSDFQMDDPEWSELSETCE